MSRRVRVTEQTDHGTVPHSPFLHLPPEVLELVLHHLGLYEWHTLRLVCHQLCDRVDQSAVWRHTWLSLQSAPDTGSSMWRLLQARRVSRLDLTEVDRQVDPVGKALQALPKIQGLSVNSRAMYFLGCFHMDSWLEFVNTLEIVDRSSMGGNYIGMLDNSWISLIAATLSNITKLTIHNLRSQIAELTRQMTPLDKLEVLDLEVAGYISTRNGVDIRDFSKLLYMHPNLTDLRIHQMALMSTRELGDASPFDPKTCFTNVGNRLLKLKSLDLQLIRGELNAFGAYNLMRTSDLRHMPHLRKLRYTMTGTQLTRYPVYEVDMEDWNIASIDTTATKPQLEHLHLELLRGVCEGEFDICLLEKLPKTLTYLSVCGEFERVSMVVTAISLGLGATLTELKVNLSTPLNDQQLCHIAKTFKVLRYLTASLSEDIKAASIQTLGDILSFKRLTLMPPAIPDTTIHDIRTNMTREFLIIPPRLD